MGKRTLLRADRVIIRADQSPLEPGYITIEDGTIQAVSSTEPEGTVDQQYDFGDLTLLPGLIDSHDHLAINIGNGKEAAAKPLEWRALKAVPNLELMLRTGITTLRCPGETGNLAFTIREAIATGLIRGPRIVLAGSPITTTTGHGWFLAIEADGPDAIRKAVREQVKAGSDFIKIIITGGATTSGSTLAAGCMTNEELHAAIDEAHRHGKRVAAHAYGGEITSEAIRMGLDCVEHGTFMTDTDLEEMAQRGTYLVSTASVMRHGADPTRVRPFMAEQFARVDKAYVDLLSRARKHNIKVTVGSDTNHAHVPEEMEILCEAGYTPAEALTAATLTAADLLEIPDTTGSLETGKSADVIAVRGNPLNNISNVRNVEFVMKEGTVLIDDRR